MMRAILYLAIGLALFALGFAMISVAAMAIFGMAALRSDLFAQVMGLYAAGGLLAVIIGSALLAHKRR
jgi:hypothetical protein